MPEKLDNLISRAKELVKDKDSEKAMSLANELVKRYSNEARVWALRGHMHALNSKYTEAASDLTQAININPTEIYYFYSRGRYRFAIHDNESAVDDFTNGLNLCDLHQKDDFREELHFWRAETLLRLGKKTEALSDLDHVPEDGYTSWTDRLRTKAQLVADCGKLEE
ncbi:MAG: tetratricopeptide repeat protein [Candidatus Angelobacter sp.]